MKELYKKYRPTLFKDIIGQEEAVSLLKSMVEDGMPHTILFSGPTGVGKTSAARILAKKLRCGKADLYEVNAASSRGIDEIRSIERQMSMSPIGGDVRVWIIDEAHKLTNEAQTALLKPTEDTPDHVYFILASSHPHKIIETIRGRAAEVKFGIIGDGDLAALILDVATKEGKSVSDELCDKIVEAAEGSARKALVILDQVIDVKDEEEQLKLIVKTDTKKQAIDICRLLINQKPKWPEVAKMLKKIDDEPETVRRIMLKYANTILLTGSAKASRAYIVIQTFRDHWFDCGAAGLSASCYEVVNTK